MPSCLIHVKLLNDHLITSLSSRSNLLLLFLFSKIFTEGILKWLIRIFSSISFLWKKKVTIEYSRAWAERHVGTSIKLRATSQLLWNQTIGLYRAYHFEIFGAKLVNVFSFWQNWDQGFSSLECRLVLLCTSSYPFSVIKILQEGFSWIWSNQPFNSLRTYISR